MDESETGYKIPRRPSGVGGLGPGPKGGGPGLGGRSERALARYPRPCPARLRPLLTT